MSDSVRDLVNLVVESSRGEMTSFAGVPCRVMPPTRRHRPAVWEAMLGTVEAMSDAYETRYFDYDHRGAAEFASALEPGRDPRLARVTWPVQGGPRRGQLCVFVLKPDGS